jgi:enamine deaminase RidA (YjgF/YER057c/UK114 family)
MVRRGTGLKKILYVNRKNPPSSTLVVLKQLVQAELVVEVDAIAVAED